MNPSLYLASISISLFAMFYLTEKINKQVFKISSPSGSRDGCIDGLRGFLAIFVFFHHFYIFQLWRVSGEWVAPHAAYLNNMGVASVQIFFMITAYLFIKKIKSGKVLWYKLYKSRVFRVVPLYLFAVIITLLYSSFLSSGTASTLEYFKAIGNWAIFNGGYYPTYFDSNKITAGVTWTLKYEWLFYLLLPTFLIFIKRKSSIALFLIVITLILFNATFAGFVAINFMPFAMGWWMTIIEEKFSDKIKINFDTPIFSSILLLATALALTLHAGTRVGLVSIQLSCLVIFFLITRGCSIFGLLRSKPAITLGEVSYSIYLLHGIVIFTLATFFNLQLTLYTLPLCLFFVVFLSLATYKYIEKPMINYGRGKESRMVMPKIETNSLE